VLLSGVDDLPITVSGATAKPDDVPSADAIAAHGVETNDVKSLAYPVAEWKRVLHSVENQNSRVSPIKYNGSEVVSRKTKSGHQGI